MVEPFVRGRFGQLPTRLPGTPCIAAASPDGESDRAILTVGVCLRCPIAAGWGPVRREVWSACSCPRRVRARSPMPGRACATACQSPVRDITRRPRSRRTLQACTQSRWPRSSRWSSLDDDARRPSSCWRTRRLPGAGGDRRRRQPVLRAAGLAGGAVPGAELRAGRPVAGPGDERVDGRPGRGQAGRQDGSATCCRTNRGSCRWSTTTTRSSRSPPSWPGCAARWSRSMKDDR